MIEAAPIHAFLEDLKGYCNTLQRSPVRLIAVVKNQSTAAINAAATAGIKDVAENYLQTALVKIAATDPGLTWHFIGTIQANKTRLIAEHFSWVHTLDREKIAERLHDARSEQHPPLNVCVQVNLDRSVSKAGIPPEQVTDFLRHLQSYPRLFVRGLMFFPDKMSQSDTICYYQKAVRLYQQVQRQFPQLDQMSMGTSSDYKCAIAAGSTMIRVGSALFGTPLDG